MSTEPNDQDTDSNTGAAGTARDAAAISETDNPARQQPRRPWLSATLIWLGAVLVAGLAALGAGYALFWTSSEEQAWLDCKSIEPRTTEQRIADCGAVILAGKKPAQEMAIAYRTRARAFFNVGEIASAVQDYGHALKTIATDAGLWAERGFAHLRNGQLTKAIDDFAKAMMLDPSAIEPVIGRGRANMALNNHERAAAFFTLAISMKPDMPEPVYLRALANVRLSRVADAAADYDRALELAPQNPNYWNARCWFRATMGIDLDLAIADCDAALKLKPNFAPAMDSQAFVLLRLGRLEGALAAYDKAIAAEQRYAWPYFGRGIVKKRMGDDAGAELDFAKARALQADIDMQYANYGETP